jgi:glycosyltransferase involved in cell wall biosynthesis
MQNDGRRRIAYLSGPVDASEVYDKWSKGRQPGYFGNSNMSEFYQLCSELNLDGYVITTVPGPRSRAQKGRFLIENRPAASGWKGIFYHIAAAIWVAGLVPSILHFRPHVLIVTAGQNYWFLLAPLKLSRITIIPVLTCTFWPRFAPKRLSWRILTRLSGRFIAHSASAVVTMSDEITGQVRSLTRGKNISITTFLPIYLRSQFSAFHPASFKSRPFRVFFAGRIETNKGVYDLVSIAENLERREPGSFHFDICGDGSELENLRRRIERSGLARSITCHGYCERDQLSSILDKSSVVIVPTTSQFEEGFNMVCAEAILAGRPLITSAVCPALPYVKEAAVEVAPDNVLEYGEAILSLARDEDLFERKRQACKLAQEQFYEAKNSWGAVVAEAIKGTMCSRGIPQIRSPGGN